MRREDIVRLAYNLNVAANLGCDLEDIAAEKVEKIRDKLVETILADFVRGVKDCSHGGGG